MAKCQLISSCFVVLLLIISTNAKGKKYDDRGNSIEPENPCQNYGPIPMKNLETYKFELYNEMENLFAISSYLKERKFKTNICSLKKVRNTEAIARKRGDYKISFSLEQEKKKFKINFEETGDIRGFISGYADFFFDNCLRRSVAYDNGRDHDLDKMRMSTRVQTNENVTWQDTASLEINSWPGVKFENWSQGGRSGDYRIFKSDRKSISTENQIHFGDFEEDKSKGQSN